ncbi:VOC family protein [Aurantivibrio plasticivorans]
MKKINSILCLIASLALVSVSSGAVAETKAESSTRLAAVALNVVSLEKATAFYTDVFGMIVKRNITNEQMSENIMAFPSGEGASLVLVQYKNREVVEKKPARIVFYAADPVAIVNKGVSLGAEVIRKPQASETMKTVIGIMRDLDGYPVEVIQR